MRELLVATKNPGKFREIKEILGANFSRLFFLGDFVVDDSDFIEDGMTFGENAEKKARYYFEKMRGNELFREGGGDRSRILAEDSGILVDALAGELGVRTRRWGAGEQASDLAWIEYFMEKMRAVPARNRGARFVCEACLAWRDDDGGIAVRRFSGETTGVITQTLEAPIGEGVPLSSCFRPDGYENVYAALSVEEKNRISHRGKAMAEVRKFCSG